MKYSSLTTTASGVHTGQHSTGQTITVVSLTSIETDCWNLSTAWRWPTTEEKHTFRHFWTCSRVWPGRIIVSRSPGLPRRLLAPPLSHSDCFTEHRLVFVPVSRVPDRAAFLQKGTDGTRGLFNKACLWLLTFKYMCFLKLYKPWATLSIWLKMTEDPWFSKETGCLIRNTQNRHRENWTRVQFFSTKLPASVLKEQCPE